MNSKTNAINNIFVLISALLASLAMIGVMTKQTSLSSACFVMSFLFVFVVYFINCISEKNISILILMLVLLVSASIIYALTEKVNNINQGIITISVIMCFDILSKIQIKNKNKNAIVAVISILALVVLYMYYFKGLDKSYIGDITVSSDAITLNFNNSNEAGMWLMAIFISIFAVAFTYKNIFIKIGLIIISVALFPIIQATKSRNSLICCFIGAILVILVWALKVKKIPRWVIALFVIMPLIAFAFYMVFIMPNYDFFENLFSAFIEKGKGLDSRNKVWSDAMESLNSWAFIGHYSEYFENQTHNSILNNACLYGIPCTVLMFYLIYRSVIRLNDKNKAFSIITILTILLLGCFEMSLFAGVSGAYLFILIAPCITSTANDRRLA